MKASFQAIASKDTVKTFARLFLALIVGLISPLLISAQEYDGEIVIATVTINGSSVAELLAYEKDGELRFPVSDLGPVLTGWVRQDVLVRIFDGRSMVESGSLEIQGMTAAWDPRSQILSIHVPVALAPVRTLSIIRSRPAPMGTLYEPEPFSAILNMSGRAGYSSFARQSDYPLFMDADLFLNLKSWVVELGAAGALEKGEPELALTKARVVKDFVSGGSRLTAGRFDTPVTGFQSSQPLIGLSLQSKTFSGARRLVTPGMEQLVLERGGMVRVFLNGSLLRSERLDPGSYRLADLPFSSGLNRIELEVQETGAQAYRFVHLQPHDEAFLGNGNLDYAVSFGFEEDKQARPMGSGFLRLGIGDRTDSSLSFQAGFNSALLGGGLAMATILGNLSLDASVSLPTGPEAYPAAFSLASRYRLSFPGRTILPTLGLSAQYSSLGFSAPRVVYATEPPSTTLRLAGAVSTALPGGVSGSLSVENRRNLDDGTATSMMAVTLRRRLAEGVTVSGLGSLAQQADGEVKPSLSLTVHSTPVGRGQSFQYSQTLTRMSSAFDLSGPVGNSRDLETSIRGRNILGHEDEVTSLAAQSRLRRPFGDFSASAFWDHDPLTGQDATALSISASGALVFAGGHLKYTRTVSDSFVVLAPQDSLGGNVVELQLGSSSTGIRSRNGSPGVGPLASYRPIQGYINLPEASPDLISDESFVVLSPAYRSGLVLRPGLKPNLSVGGYLLDRNGKPVSWTTGRLLDREGIVLDQGFTDSDGRFEFYGLSPGVYSIRWASKPAFSMELTIPADGPDMIELGEIQLVNQSVEGAL